MGGIVFVRIKLCGDVNLTTVGSTWGESALSPPRSAVSRGSPSGHRPQPAVARRAPRTLRSHGWKLPGGRGGYPRRSPRRGRTSRERTPLPVYFATSVWRQCKNWRFFQRKSAFLGYVVDLGLLI